jgi:hypothetical protein
MSTKTTLSNRAAITSCCVPTALTDFEAAAYRLLNAFNRAGRHTQQVILNEIL